MPIVNTNQARVELSARQVVEFINVIHAHFTESEQMVMISIEETNLGNTVAIGGRGMPTTLIEHSGRTWATDDMTKPKPESKTKKRSHEDF
jgi:hypothetical protein